MLHVSKARLIYVAIFVILIASALMPALVRFWPDGPHDGGEL